MPITIIWTAKAITDLDKIYNYYSKKSQTAAIRLYNSILDNVELLRTFPEMAPLEPSIEGNLKYRGLIVKKHFKIVYYVKSNNLYIVTIGDCRQKPGKLFRFIK